MKFNNFTVISNTLIWSIDGNFKYHITISGKSEPGSNENEEVIQHSLHLQILFSIIS